MAAEAATPTQVVIRETPKGPALSKDQLDLIKRTICRPKNRPATNDELALFQYQCERTGLDPFSRQIYAIFRYNKRAGREEMTIQSAIDGFRLIAERTQKYIGQDGPFWCGADGVWKDTWIDKNPPVAAKVVVKKLMAGVVGETPAVAHYSEYVPMYNGNPTGQWGQMPALMIGNFIRVKPENVEPFIPLARFATEAWHKHTGRPLAQIEAETERNHYFTAHEAKEFGLVDDVLSKISDEKKSS